MGRFNTLVTIPLHYLPKETRNTAVQIWLGEHSVENDPGLMHYPYIT